MLEMILVQMVLMGLLMAAIDLAAAGRLLTLLITLTRFKC